MEKAGLFSSTALPLLLIGSTILSSSTTTSAAASSSSKALPLHPRFRSHLKCPYADKWLAKGPEAAARELGLDENHRKLQTEQPVVQGSCTYINGFTRESTCMQFTGSSWTTDDMTTRCANESGGGTFATEGCTMTDGSMGGWCTKMISDNKYESTVMVLSAMADCSGSKMACESFMSGSFIADGECLSTEEASGGNLFGGESSTTGGPPAGVDISGGGSWPGAASSSGGDDDAMKCILAPGAIGAAHQAGFSKGYSASCPGAPGQESPYMWPLKWAANTESQSMAFGSDDVVYTSRGRTFYMLDRNWKRSDTTYQEGMLRTIGQGPCDEEDVMEDFEFMGCRKNQTDGTMSTMIHRENLMYFISWKMDEDPEVGETDPTKIEECSMINLAVVGNIRPDWFMDKRGDDTDVQYLGNQHVFYDGIIPKLVKQWRKKDFASQYFVMSMQENPPNKLAQDSNAPVEDNMNWPLILNIPGEGFGDDSLQVYRNHSLLTDDDEDLFKLIENYEATGGVCVDARAAAGEGGGGDVGPPVLEEGEEIPSNLVVDPLAWISNEITFSPIWVPETTFAQPQTPSMEESIGSALSGIAGLATSIKDLIEVSDRVTVESCYDESTQTMDMSIHYHDIEPTMDGKLPWMALGYRPSELCAMTPPDGGVTPILLVTMESQDVAPQAHKTNLVPEAKALSPTAFESMMTLTQPLDDVDGYMDVSIDAPMVSNTAVEIARSIGTDDTVSLHFKQAVGENPETMNLMYAIGMSSSLGIHTTRGCFQVEPTPCGKGESQAATMDEKQDTESITFDLGDTEEEEVDAETVKSSSANVSVGIMFAVSAIFAAALVGLR